MHHAVAGHGEPDLQRPEIHPVEASRVSEFVALVKENKPIITSGVMPITIKITKSLVLILNQLNISFPF